MLIRTAGIVVHITDRAADLQELSVRVPEGPEARAALNYPGLTGRARVGDRVLLNVTAQDLRLGTGGYDFVMAILEQADYPALVDPPADRAPGHIIKARYTPSQNSVLTLEEQDRYQDVWEKDLGGMQVLVGQLHSQIAPAAAALHVRGLRKIVYVMTDQAALPIALSRLVRDLTIAGLLQATITCGQAFGGDHETVTLHSALIAAKQILDADAAIVCQGPGNAGTGTKYGFSGIEQAQNLDIVAALNGVPVAIARMSSADRRERHQGTSHHTRTSLALAHARCLVPLPSEADRSGIPDRHVVIAVDGAVAALDLLASRNIRVTSMGRDALSDPLFFLAAAAAGMINYDEGILRDQ